MQASAGNGADGCPAKGLLQPDMIEREGRFVVRLKPSIARSLGPERMAKVLTSFAGMGSNAKSLGGETYQVTANSTSEAAAAAQKLSQNPEVVSIEPDYPIEADYLTDDPESAKQWAHENVDSFGAWEVTTGSRATVVGVIDSGIDYSHPDLAGNMWRNPDETKDGKDSDGNGFADDIHGWDFVNEDGGPMADDTKYHGTHVAGTVGALGDNGVGVAGHSPRVSLMGLKTLNKSKSGYSSDMIRAIDYAIQNGAHIINASIGSASYSSAVHAALERARQADILFVASAGNLGNNTASRPSYPASYKQDNVIGVAATASDDSIPSWSNYGASTVHIAAPGSKIWSTRNGASYQSLSGTSMASPLVAGVAALIRSARPDLSYSEVKNLILETVDTSSALSAKVMTGRINAAAALDAALAAAPGSAPDPKSRGRWADAVPDAGFQSPCE